MMNQQSKHIRVLSLLIYSNPVRNVPLVYLRRFPLPPLSLKPELDPSPLPYASLYKTNDEYLGRRIGRKIRPRIRYWRSESNLYLEILITDSVTPSSSLSYLPHSPTTTGGWSSTYTDLVPNLTAVRPLQHIYRYPESVGKDEDG